jgi:hypothetical protein
MLVCFLTSFADAFELDMSRKRKADVDEEDLQFSRDVSRIRNPYVRKTHFRTISDQGIDVRTTISERETSAAGSSAAPAPVPETISSDADLGDVAAKKQTQVFWLHCQCYLCR